MLPRAAKGFPPPPFCCKRPRSFDAAAADSCNCHTTVNNDLPRLDHLYFHRKELEFAVDIGVWQACALLWGQHLPVCATRLLRIVKVVNCHLTVLAETEQFFSAGREATTCPAAQKLVIFAGIDERNG